MKFLTFFLLLLISLVAVNAQTPYSKTSTGPIAIPSAGQANPYPSTITIDGTSGLGPSITNVSVTLNGLTHSYLYDLQMLLVSPTGRAFVIQGEVGGENATNLTYTLSDSGATFFPGLTNPVNGATYKPASYTQRGFFEFTAPAPTNQAAYFIPSNDDPVAGDGTDTFAAAFNGTSPFGTWSLYIYDVISDPGFPENNSLQSWTLTITAPPTTASGVTVTGRVLAPPTTSRSQMGVANAIVQLTDMFGQTRSARTDAKGYFKLDDVAPGETYVFRVKTRQYQYAEQIVTINENLDELNFYPNR